jgi:cytosine/adenosine deaminase-related metal-dependent hydrolase
MFLYRQGPMYDWLKHQRDMSDCGLGSPVQHLDRCGYLAENLLAVHANYLWRDDALVLGRRKVSVAHCPRSHDYFRHLRFPYEVLAAAGVNVCLGTDSLASLRPLPNQPLELNMFAELGQFATAVPNAAPVAILRLATVNAAAALGQKGNLGELAPQALADLIAIPFQGASAQVHEAVVHHSGAVAASMIDGRWALAPQC